MFKKIKSKILVFLIFIPLLQSCGYVPMYSSNSAKNFYFEEVILNGDRETNIYINDKLKKHNNFNSEKKFILNINTNYSKNSISKDLTGKTVKYEVEIESIVDVEKNNINKNILIKEKFIMENFNNELDEKKYEDSIKKNYSNLFINKLILQLMNL